jgi:hypothetical protein
MAITPPDRAQKKWPASVDLQASKKSKGLQEQQLQSHSNTLALRSLAISTAGCTQLTRLFRIIMRLRVTIAGNDSPPRLFSKWIENSGNRAPNCGFIGRTPKQRIRSIHWRKNPIEGQNPQEPGFRYLPMPATSRVIAGNFHFAEDFHRIDFRECRLRALPLQIDIVPVFGARKYNSVGFTHNL